ncbi:DNA-3-methyladenine glycosylase 2 [Deinococcus saxicola]|uniref:DNA-3-methyladenine glycosylase 2 n=1 Tax=Deinococcus saxicola TaxID=249406 RepID=UPI0039EF884C
MLAADAAFDGQFITGVVSTGIYCLPSCRARKPKAENVLFYATPAQARVAGLRACLRCKPDGFQRGVDAGEAEFVVTLAKIVPSECANVVSLARHFQVSTSTLHELFRTCLQITPADWLTSRRIAAAGERLLTTRQSVAEIAYEVGFESLSVFGTQFRRRQGLTPQAFRQMPARQGFTLRLPQGYRADAILRDLGRDLHGLNARTQERQHLTAWRVPSGPLLVALTFEDGGVQVRPDAAFPLDVADWLSLHHMTLRVLGLTHDPARFEALVAAQPDLAPLLQRGRGLRLPLVADLFDGLIWAVLGQQVTFSFAGQMRRRLIQRCGTEVGGGLVAPPTPTAVTALGAEGLRKIGLTRTRAALLLDLAGRIVDGSLNLESLRTGLAPAALRALLDIPGIGPWTANYLLVRVLGFQDGLPVGDSALATALQQYFSLPDRPGPKQTAALMARFAPYRSLATFYFWQSLSNQGVHHESTRPLSDLPQPA